MAVYHPMMLRMSFILLAASLALVGCTKPIPKGVDSYDPTGRIQSMLRVAEQNDRSKIPQLIEALDSDDPVVRMTSIRTLERLTGETLGYDHAGRERDRRAAADRWVEWYESQGLAGTATGQRMMGAATETGVEGG